MRVALAVILVLATQIAASNAQAAGTPAYPVPPACVCSSPIEIVAPTGKAAVTNCVCAPQYCAVTLGSSVAIDCTEGAALNPMPSNCANITQVVGSISQEFYVLGAFRFQSIPRPGQSDAVRVGLTPVPAYPGQPANEQPLISGLSGIGPYDVIFSGNATTYRLRYLNGQKAQVQYIVFTQSGAIEYGKLPVTPQPPEKVETIELMHKDGLKRLRILNYPELFLFEVCALQ